MTEKVTTEQEIIEKDEELVFEAEEIKDGDEILSQKMDEGTNEENEPEATSDDDENNRKTIISAAAIKEAKKKMAEGEDEDEEGEMDGNDDDSDIEAEACDPKEKDEDMKKEDIDVTDDIAALTDGEELTEEFKDKAKTIFETAINSKVKQIREDLEKDYSKKLEKAKTEIQEQAAAEMESSVDFVVEQVNKYMDFVVEEWMQKNELAIESSLRADIAEEFIGGLKNLFMEHYIEVPAEKADLVEDLTAKVEELKKSVNEAVEESMKLKEENNAFKKHQIIEKCTSDLPLSQKEKLVALVEDIDFTDEVQFEKKVGIIKNSYFVSSKMKDSADNKETLETLGENVDTSVDEQKAPTKMDIYAQAVSQHKNMNLIR